MQFTTDKIKNNVHEETVTSYTWEIPGTRLNSVPIMSDNITADDFEGSFRIYRNKYTKHKVSIECISSKSVIRNTEIILTVSLTYGFSYWNSPNILHFKINKDTLSDKKWASVGGFENIHENGQSIYPFTLTFRQCKPINTGMPASPYVLKNALHSFVVRFDDKEPRDVTFKIGEKEFKAHKVILTNISTVFAAMFKSDMLEKTNAIVNVHDVDPDVFEEMLHFIYTGELPNLDKFALDLLIVADKYAIKCLGNICEAVLMQNISRENASKLLEIADRCNCRELKKAVFAFMGNPKSIELLNNADFQAVLASIPKLGIEFVQSYNLPKTN